MSQYTTPLEAVFEMQRQTIEQTGKMAETAVTVPKELGERFRMSGEDAREMRTNAIEASRESAHRALDMVESVSSGSANVEEFRDRLDDAFDAVENQQAAYCETFDAEYEQFEDRVSENVDEQVTFFLELNDELEDQVLDFVEQVTEETSTLTAETVKQTEEVVEIDVSTGTDTADESASDVQESTDGSDESSDVVPEDVPDDKVACRVCGNVFNAITHPHLQTHDMTVAEYREEFGEDVPLRPDE